MKARVAEATAVLAREQQRLELYENNLLPQAEFNAETSFEDYQDAIGDLTAVMRARIGEYELKLDHANLRAEEIMTQLNEMRLDIDTARKTAPKRQLTASIAQNRGLIVLENPDLP